MQGTVDLKFFFRSKRGRRLFSIAGSTIGQSERRGRGGEVESIPPALSESRRICGLSFAL